MSEGRIVCPQVIRFLGEWPTLHTCGLRCYVSVWKSFCLRQFMDNVKLIVDKYQLVSSVSPWAAL
jgi:hypothetical protein